MSAADPGAGARHDSGLQKRQPIPAVIVSGE